MEDQLLTCTILSQCGTGPISLHENHECRTMKFFRLVEAMEDQLLRCALLSLSGTGPILRVKSSALSMDDVPRHDKFSWATVVICLVTSGVSLDRFPLDISEVVPLINYKFS